MNWPLIIFWSVTGCVFVLCLGIAVVLFKVGLHAWQGRTVNVLVSVKSNLKYWMKFYVLGGLLTILIILGVFWGIRQSTFAKRLQLSGNYVYMGNTVLDLRMDGDAVFYPIPAMAQIGSWKLVDEGVQVKLKGDYLLFRLVGPDELMTPMGLVIHQRGWTNPGNH